MYLQGQTSEMEWESTLNTEATTSDSTSCSTEHTDLTDNDSNEDLCKDDENPFAGNIHQASSVINNLASGYDKGRADFFFFFGFCKKKLDKVCLLFVNFMIVNAR